MWVKKEDYEDAGPSIVHRKTTAQIGSEAVARDENDDGDLSVHVDDADCDTSDDDCWWYAIMGLAQTGVDPLPGEAEAAEEDDDYCVDPVDPNCEPCEMYDFDCWFTLMEGWD